jgi:peptidoglycan/LPS O-acetylase OafA/YrhL
MKDSANLDVLRAVAVGFVVISHAPILLGSPSSVVYNVKALGHVGVAMFFVHTTLVLMRSLERQGAAMLPFLVRRAFRIYPLAVTVVCVLSLLYWLGGKPPDATTFLSNLFLVQNFTGSNSMPHPLWTLPIELQMYLLLPALYFVARRSVQGVTIALLACMAVAVVGGESAGMSLLSYAPCFVPGALAYAMGSRGRQHHALLWAVVAVGAVVIPMGAAAGLPETPMLWVLCSALGLAIPRCRELRLGPVARGAKLVATYSYGIYLTHVIAFGATFTTAELLPSVGQVLGFIALLAGLSALSYHAIEKPGIEMGMRIADRIRRPAIVFNEARAK